MTGEEKTKKKSSLRVLEGGLTSTITWKGIHIVAAPKDAPPFPVEAVAFEEDTFLVMSADPTVRDPKIPLIRIMSNLIETRPQTPGAVLVQGDAPVRLLAIIHDFNEDPSWKEEWIEKAFQGIFEAAERMRLRSLALPLLGTVHGSLDRCRSVQFLAESLHRRLLHDLLFLWLVVPTGTARDVLELLKPQLGTKGCHPFAQ